MPILSVLLATLLGLVLGVAFGASIRADSKARLKVRLGIIFVLMLCIFVVLTLFGAPGTITFPLFGVGSAVGLALQFASDENGIVRLFAETDG